MTIILTDHAKERLKKRWIPDPNLVAARQLRNKDLKKLGLIRIKKDNLIFSFENYLYICLKDDIRVVVITAYKYYNHKK
jgi:hypothetical protein